MHCTTTWHVSSLSHNIQSYTRALLRHIRPALTESMAASLGASLVQSRLDYANAIMYGMSASNILSLVWFCLLFAIFQQVSDSLTSTGFPFTTAIHSCICDAERFASAGHTMFTVKRGSSCDAADVLRCKLRMLMRYKCEALLTVLLRPLLTPGQTQFT